MLSDLWLLPDISQAIVYIEEAVGRTHRGFLTSMPVQVASSTDPDLASIRTPVLPTTPDDIALSDARSQADGPSDSVHQVGFPFPDFAGRCFMRACLLAELFDSWVRTNQVPSHEQADSAATTHYTWHVAGWFRSSMGAVLCTLAAAALGVIFWASCSRSWIPFIFLVVISYVVLRFGDIAGLIGTISAALLFASVLFEPRPSLAMSNPVERNHVFSMIILGIFASEFLGRRRSSTPYRP